MRSGNSRGSTLEFTIAHRPRVTRRLHLELDDRGELVVVAPRHWPARHIRETLAQNIDHVERFIIKARQKILPPLVYAPGGRHLFLGRSCQLRVELTTAKRTRVTLENDFILIRTPLADPGKLQAVLQGFYRNQATRIFDERLRVIVAKAPWARDRSVTLKLRKMKRSWGNCSAKDVIKLNTHLVKAPLAIIDSVIAHEVCHLAVMNHSREFYSLLEQLNPAWKRDRKILRVQGHIWLQ